MSSKQYSVAELATHVKGLLRGVASGLIEGVADLKSARSNQLSFLGNSRYVAAAKASKAGVILATAVDAASLEGCVIVVENPSAAFALIVAHFAPAPVSFAPGIHPTAVIAPGVELGEGVSIQAHAVLEPGVRVGARTVIGAGVYLGHESCVGDDAWLYPNVVIRERSRLGNRVVIHSGTVVGSDGFGYETQKGRHVKIPQVGYVQIDDDVEIGANVAIDRGRFDRTWIQEGTKIDNLVQIAHNVTVGKHCFLVALSGIAGSTSLGNYVTLAGQSGIAGHLHIGDQVIIGAQSAVAKDAPPKIILSGRHAKPLREALKIEALTNRLPELLERIRQLEAKLEIPPPA